MLQSLITVIGIVASVGTNSTTLFRAPIKEKKEETTTLTWNGKQNETTSQNNNMLNNVGNYWVNTQYNALASSNAYTIHESSYAHTIYYTENATDYRLMGYYSNSTLQTAIITISQIDVYMGIRNNTINYTQTMNNNLSGTNNVTVEMYISYRTAMASYVGIPVSESIDYVKTKWENIRGLTEQEPLFSQTYQDYNNEITFGADILVNTETTAYVCTIVYFNENAPTTTRNRGYYYFEPNTRTITGSIIAGTATYEYIDIPGLMYTVLTLPFTFISQAFNITIFVGTPYQVNIGALVISIVGALIMIFLIRMILKIWGK